MKRLVDETTDELTRSLLTAGIEHRPPPGNKARVIAALGAGGAAGLFSSNAFAWMSTTAGKVTAVGVAVGVASAVWVAIPADREARSGALAQASSRSTAPEHSTTELRPSANDPAAEEPSDVPPPELARNAEGAASAPVAEATGASGDPAADGDQDRSPMRRERSTRKTRKTSSKDRAVASMQREPRREAPQPATEAPEEPPTGEALEASASEHASLDSEVKLVDDMHWAARRNDRAALGRFLELYRATFPDGQLKHEVAEFAARLDRPDLSSPR